MTEEGLCHNISQLHILEDMLARIHKHLGECQDIMRDILYKQSKDPIGGPKSIDSFEDKPV